MPTNFAIDDRLIEEAQRLGHIGPGKAVTVALDEYIPRHRQQAILALFGSIEYDQKYDYKRARKSGRR